MGISIGCGSWADREYAGLLYPPGFAGDLRLSSYAMWFDHVEVNSTYYRIPDQKIATDWVSATPDSFQFDVRLHRAISQSPALAAKDGRLLSQTFKFVEPLIRAKRLGTFLLVLSPNFTPERHQLHELEGMIEKMRPHRLAVELRHSAWVDGRNRATTLDFYLDQQIIWVAVDMPRIKGSILMPPIDEVTHPEMAYLRLHGQNLDYTKLKTAEERHTYFYSEAELREIVQRARSLAVGAKNVRVVANNHALDFAPKTALILKQMLQD